MIIEKNLSFKKRCEMMKKIKILAVDDKKKLLDIYKKNFSHDNAFKISLAKSIKEARGLIKNSEKEPYDVVLMDSDFGAGIKEAVKIKKEYPKIFVAVISEYTGLIQKTLKVDICIGKPIEDMSALKELLITHLSGKFKKNNALKEIKLLNVRIGKSYEGFEGITTDRLKIRWIAYVLPEHPEKFFTIGVSASKGCNGKCFNCLSQEKGLIRELEKKEIKSQIFHGLNSFFAFKSFYDLKKNEKIKFGINSTCGGDWMNVPNPLKTLEAFLEIKKIKNFQPKFILTSVGNIKILKWLTKNPKGIKYLKLLKPELYFSLNYPFQSEREKRMKSTKGQDIKTLFKLHYQASLISKEKNTVSYVLAKGINDTKEHAGELANLFKGYEKRLLLKLQKSENIKKIRPNDNEIISFQNLVLEKNSNINYRVRNIIGSDQFFGCGNTVFRKGRFPKKSTKLHSLK